MDVCFLSDKSLRHTANSISRRVSSNGTTFHPIFVSYTILSALCLVRFADEVEHSQRTPPSSTNHRIASETFNQPTLSYIDVYSHTVRQILCRPRWIAFDIKNTLYFQILKYVSLHSYFNHNCERITLVNL